MIGCDKNEAGAGAGAGEERAQCGAEENCRTARERTRPLGFKRLTVSAIDGIRQLVPSSSDAAEGDDVDAVCE